MSLMFRLSAQSTTTIEIPDSSTFYFNKGYALLKQEKYDEAIFCFKRSIYFKPHSVTSYVNWAVCLVKPLKNQENIKIMNEALDKLYIAESLSPNYLLAKQNILAVKASIAISFQKKELLAEVLDSFETLNKDFDDEDKEAGFYGSWATALMFHEKWYGNIEVQKNKMIGLFLKANILETGRDAYNLSCLYSLLNEKERALMWLEECFMNKLPDRDYLDNDTDFDNIRDEDAYKDLVDKYYNKPQGIDIRDLQEHRVILTDKDAYLINMLLTESDEESSFQGGDDALKDFLLKNIRNPEEISKYEIRAEVYVDFVVDIDGTIKNVRTSMSTYRNPKLSKPYHDEAKRLMSIMPNWMPATRNNKPVQSTQSIIIKFGKDY